MKDSHYEKSYQLAHEAYAEIGVDTEIVMENLQKVPLSLHCWQGDDVGGFESPDAELSGGGIQVTGNYPGKAGTIQELRGDIEKVFSLIPGKHRLNLHASYGEFGGSKIDRDKVEPSHFSGWAEWAKEQGVGLDFNATFYSHPLAEAGFTLSSKNKGIRDFWIEHAKRSRKIAAYLGKELGSPAIHNTWIPDGFKDYPVDRIGYRNILKNSLDEIFSEKHPENFMKDAVETKLFGIGSEAYVVGSHEFYMFYAALNNVMVCLDLGHFHPTELIADKISSVMLFSDELLLHVSRPMHWDSDHVVVLNDDIRFLGEELVRCGKLDKIHIGLDFFDATLNRVGAWVTGTRAALKGLMIAMLQPIDKLVEYEEAGNYYGRMGLSEQLKSMPFGAVWDMYCMRNGVVQENRVVPEVFTYEKNFLQKRN
ncbi:MAG: L-rhamnose isomerase [Spirochaetales bacterium]|nr:L-rhamnose isomerase [Spirochaetales bacterium]